MKSIQGTDAEHVVAEVRAKAEYLLANLYASAAEFWVVPTGAAGNTDMMAERSSCPLCGSHLASFWDWLHLDSTCSSHQNCMVRRTYRVFFTFCSWLRCSFESEGAEFHGEQHWQMFAF